MSVQFTLVACSLMGLVSTQCNNGNQAPCAFPPNSGLGPGYRLFAPCYGKVNCRTPSPVYDPETCRSQDTIPLPLSEMYRRQPVFTFVVNDNCKNRGLDSVCTTFFRVTNNDNTYVVYDSTTFTDGTTEITATLSTDANVGETGRASPDYIITQRVLSQLDEKTYIICEVLEFGEPTGHNVFAVSFGAINRNLIAQSKQAVNSKNLAPEGLYVLPYRYPPKCVTQQVCTLPNPLLYAQSGFAYSSNTRPSYIYPGRGAPGCSNGC